MKKLAVLIFVAILVPNESFAGGYPAAQAFESVFIFFGLIAFAFAVVNFPWLIRKAANFLSGRH